jgi:hypothetical protein
MCDGVTHVCVHKPQRLEHYSGKRALRSGEFLRDQTPKRRLLHETSLIGPVQILGVGQKFTFPCIYICCAILALEVPTALFTAFSYIISLAWALGLPDFKL